MKSFFKKFPFLYCVFGVLLIVGLLFARRIIGDHPMAYGIWETIMGIIVLTVWGFVFGRKSIIPDFTGASYGFRMTRYLLIINGILASFGIFSYVVSKSQISVINISNLALVAIFVGIVEEFTCRGMIFGGLSHTLGNTRTGIILAAVISSAIFGFLHIAGSVFSFHQLSFTYIAQVAGKIIDAGSLGFCLSLIYIKTRNIWIPALIHSAYDALILATQANDSLSLSYVNTDSEAGIIILTVYLISVLILLPLIIKTIKELRNEPERIVLPLDDEFIPRSPIYPLKKKDKA